MKKKIDYSKWDDNKLTKQYKALKFVTGMLAGILIVLFAMTIYLSIREKKFHPLLVSPIALSAIIPINFKRMKEMRREIEARKGNGD